jgi:predicted DNA-binding antitoxin AbrB/MazE fold protein
MYAEVGASSMDSQVTDAIYTEGVLKPLGTLSLHESERVRITIERREQAERDRGLAFERLRAGIEKMEFFLSEPLPSRDELHDRI